MAKSRMWRHFDFVLLAATVALTVGGLVMIYSANLGSPDDDLRMLWRRQGLLATAGVGLIFLLAAFPRDYHWLGDFWWLAYALATVLLGLALVFGTSEIGEVRGWLNLGFVYFQPAFPAMILLAIAVGSALGQQRPFRRGGARNTPVFGSPKTSLVEEAGHSTDTARFLMSSAIAVSLAALVFMQPDMATAAVLVVMWLAMLLESDIKKRYLAITCLVGLGLLIPLWGLMENYPYMRERIIGFLYPGSNPDTSYQLEQASIAIGSGGLWGKGLFQGTQSQLRYLPVRHTDFVFAVLSEELGFAGALVLFAAYAVLFLRLLRIVIIAQDAFGRLLTTGVLAMILFQFSVNVGMNLGLLPVAGLPLPLVSYGPAALLTTMTGIGLAENVAMRHKKLEF
jgi:rod shape determining protein RodA